MADIEDLRAGLISQLDKLEKQIEGLDRKDPVARTKAIKTIKEFLQEVNSDLENYETEVLSVPVKQANKYQEILKQLKTRFTNLKKSYEDKKVAGTERERLFRGIKKKDDRDPSEMQTEEVIQRIKEVQEDDIEVLLGVVGHVERFNEMADTINAQLDEQIRKLDQVNAVAKDTESELKRTQKYIRQFLRTVYTDKILMCLIFLIFCAIVTLIVLNVTGVGKKLSTQVDKITKPTTTNSTTTAITGNRILRKNISHQSLFMELTEAFGEIFMSQLV